MAKIKITKQQAIMLENLNKPKVLKITESQYKAILQHEGLDENAVIPKIYAPMDSESKRDYKNTVNNLKGVVKESEELWKEFVNELYGLHESSSNIYEKLIRMMETFGFVENRKLSKVKFGGDKNKAKEVILGGLNKLHETGSPYLAMEVMDKACQESMNTHSGSMNEYDDNLPIGTKYSPDSPWNQKDVQYRDKTIDKNQPFKLVTNVGNNAIFKKDGELYQFSYEYIDKDEFYDYADVPQEFTGQDEDGLPNYKYGDWEITDETISNYVNDNLETLLSPENYGEGDPKKLFDEGKLFVKIIDSTGDDTVVEFDNTIYEAVNSLKKKSQEDEELEESTTTGSALGGISLVMPLGSKPEDYIIKKPVKENAFDRTQWAGGEFVEFDDCTKLNNNKEAQKGKCSVGAIDNVVKTKKTATNVNAPSLGKKAK
jgi:hypothetical protein